MNAAATVGRWCTAAVLGAALCQAGWAGQRQHTIPRPVTIRPSVALAKSLAIWDKEQQRLANACALDARQAQTEWGYAVDYNVLLDTPHVFSVAVHVEQYCGGAHPDTLDRGVMFDVRTGERVQAQGVFKRGMGLVPHVRTLLRAARLARLDREQKAYGCEEILRDAPEEYIEPEAVVLGKTGLHFMYTGPNVDRYCYGTVVLPYSQLTIGPTS